MRSRAYHEDHVAHQLTIGMMIKSVLFTVKKQAALHEPRNVFRSDTDTRIRESQGSKRDSNELEGVIRAEDTIARELFNLDCDLLCREADTFTIDNP